MGDFLPGTLNRVKKNILLREEYLLISSGTMSDRPPSGVSRTQTVYENLRAALLACRLRPGQKIVIGDLCRTHDVSLGAIREALSRLTAEGLVIAAPQRGFRVAPVSEADLTQLTDARVEIEQSCLGRSIVAGDLAWEARLVASFHELSGTPERVAGDVDRLSDAWVAVHARFHQALVEGCDNVWLLRLRTTLYAQSERYRRLSVPLARRDRGVADEHRAILDATLARDAERACALLDRHLRATTRILLQSGDVQRIARESEAA